LGAKIGGIPELIDNENGLLFESGNMNDLNNKIQTMFSQHFDYQKIAKTAREKFAATEYYEKLLSLYQKILLK